MKKTFLVIIVIIVVLVSACGTNPTLAPNTPVVQAQNANISESTQTVAPTKTILPTDMPYPIPTFVTPQDGTTLDYEALNFNVDPVSGAEGYSWTFIQDGEVLWETRTHRVLTTSRVLQSQSNSSIADFDFANKVKSW